MMESWAYPERIFCEATVTVTEREGSESGALAAKIAALEKKYGCTIRRLTLPEFLCSSTEIRARIAEGKSIEGMTPEAVVAYIREQGLYG